MRNKDPIPLANILKNANNSKIDVSLKFFMSSVNKALVLFWSKNSMSFVNKKLHKIKVMILHNIPSLI